MIDEAVKEAKSLLRDNRDWSFNYCIQNVANRYRVDIGELKRAFGGGRGGRRKKRVTKPIEEAKGRAWWLNY